MSFFNSSLIDLVFWDEMNAGGDPQNPLGEPVFAWKFVGKDGNGTNLSTFTQLIVRESQEAVLFTKGQILGKFGPGRYTLSTENLPLLRNLYGIPFGGKNPFFAEVWFVNKLVPLTIDWNTTQMMYHDPDYQAMVPLCASGRYGVKVQNAERFLVKLVGTATSFTAHALTYHFQGALDTKTKSILLSYMQSQKIGIKSVSAYLEKLSAALQSPMQAFWEEYGFNLEGFYITSVSVDQNDPAGARILEAISRQSAQVIGGYSWQQSKAFEVADNATGQSGSGGLLGALLVTGMMGGSGGGGGLLQPNPQGVPVTGASGQVGSGVQPPVREVFCSKCAKKYSSSSKFCPHCGDPYTPCPACGADNDTDARRCVSCGTALAVTQSCAKCHGALPTGANCCPSCGQQVNGVAICKKCHTPLTLHDAFCGNCGQKVD